jgi:hypothetical protein
MALGRYLASSIAGLGIALAIASAAAAGDYWVVGEESSNKMIDFVDVSTLVDKGGGVYSVWTRGINEGSEVTRAGWKEMVQHVTYDCNKRRTNTLDMALYDLNDRLLNSHYSSGPWQSVTPDTIGADEMRLVCSNPKMWPSNKNFFHDTIGLNPVEFADRYYEYWMAHKGS